MPFVIGTAGHVDHGKTALVKALTGIDTDTLEEEKKRGLSINLGFAHLDLPGGRRVAIVDVPGHERFIKNMLAGVTGIDAVLFCVAADDGVMPQTLEHLAIVHLLGVERGVFVVTKADLADGERIEKVKREIEQLTSTTGLKGSPMVAVSYITGEGLEELKGLIENLDFRAFSMRGPFFRLPVDRSFSIKGFGAVVAGTVASGSISREEEAFVWPGGKKIRVRGIQSHHRSVEKAQSGERAALNLGGVSSEEIKRGDMVVSKELRNFKPRILDCSLERLPSFKNKRTLTFHHLAGSAVARLKVIKNGAARIRLDTAQLVLRGDRFILRDPSLNKTVAGGVALIPWPEEVRPPSRLLERADTVTVLSEKNGIERKTLSLMLNRSSEEMINDGAKVMGARAYTAEHLKKEKGVLLNFLFDYHRSHPSREGAIIEELPLRLKGAERGCFLDILAAEGAIEKRDGAVRLPGHSAKVEGVDKRIVEEIEALTACAAKTHGELVALPFGKDAVERVLRHMLKSGAIVRIKEGTFISAAFVERARKALEKHLGEKGRIRAAEFRDILGCGRKLAIEVLEYFDSEKITLRVGDERTLRHVERA